jgi:hypothetical protein
MLNLIKPCLSLALLAISFSSCTYGINRELVGTPRPVQYDCNVIIKKSVDPYALFDSTQVTRIETIALTDAMTTRCSEAEAKILLRNEACSLGANWINITAERKPNGFSSCYICEAEIYFIDQDVDAYYDYVSPNMVGFTTEQKMQSNTAVWGWVVGFIIGFTATLLLLQ